MVTLLSLFISILRIMIFGVMFILLNQTEIFYIMDEKTFGILSLGTFLFLLFFVTKIPLEKLFKIKFDSLDKAITYYLRKYTIKKKIKINEQCYLVIQNTISVCLFQENNNCWDLYKMPPLMFYKDLEIYCKKISDDDLLIFAYYISSNESENNCYQMKDYMNRDFLKETIEITNSSKKKNLISFYTVLKLNDNAYHVIINGEMVKLK